MIRSFWDLKEMKKTRSVVKVQQRLMTEYVTWIVKESQGYRIMEKEIRNWFEQYIAPDKHDVKVSIAVVKVRVTSTPSVGGSDSPLSPIPTTSVLVLSVNTVPKALSP